MKTIAIVCPAGIVSGKEIVSLELGEGLREQGMQVEYVTAWWGDGQFRALLREHGFPYHVMRLGFISATLTVSAVRMTLHQLIHVPGLFISYQRFLRRLRPTRVVHTNWHHALLLLPFLNPKRDVYWSHEILPDSSRLRTVFRAIDKRVGFFVAVSQATAQSLERVGVRSDKIRVIYNGMAAPKTSRTVPPQASVLTNIGIVGQVGSWKGHDDLVSAFAITASAFPLVQLNIFGKGSEDYESYLRRRVEELGLTARVMWHGFIENRDEIYRQVHLCVVPSRVADPLPTSAIEASIRGIPVIASRCGGLPEIVEDGVTGFLFGAGDVEQLASHLKMLISDPALAAALGERGRERAMQKFDRQRFIRDFSEILSDAPPCSQ